MKTYVLKLNGEIVSSVDAEGEQEAIECLQECCEEPGGSYAIGEATDSDMAWLKKVAETAEQLPYEEVKPSSIRNKAAGNA